MSRTPRPVVDGGDPFEAPPDRSRRGPIDPELLRLSPALRRHLLVCATLAVVTTLVVLAQAEVVGRRLPRIIDGDLDASWSLAMALGAIGIVRLGVRWLTEISASVAAAETRRALTRRVTEHALALDEAGAADAPPARLTTLVTDGVDALDPWIRSYVPALCLACVLPLAAGLRILFADLTSALILLVAVPLIPLFMVLIGKYADERARRQWATLQRLAGHFHDVLVGLPTLRLFGRAGAQVRNVRVIAEQYRVAVMRTLRVAFLSAGAMELLATLSVALVAVTIGVRLTEGAVALPTALVVLLLAPECSLPIRRVGAAFHAAQAGADAAAELQEVLATSTVPDGPVSSLPTNGDTPGLQVRGAAVIDPVRGDRVGPADLDVTGGAVVAVVGASGAGKSTLLDAVRCRVPLQRGVIQFDGIDVAALSRSARSDVMAWIPQLPDPVGPDVRSSVGAGEAVDVEEIDRALRSLDLGPLATRRPSDLSGGERQRVAVATALVRCRAGSGVRLLLADEPTSHLDGRRAGLVAAALREVADSGAAVLVATHDPRLIGAADRVVRLDATTEPSRDGEAPIVDERSSGFAVPAGQRDGLPVAPAPLPDLAGHASRHDLDWFRRAAGQVRGRLLLSRAIGVATEACAVGLAAVSAWLIVRAAERPSFADLALAAVAVRAFALGKGLFRYGERLVSHDATFRLLADVRADVVERVGQIAPAGIPGWGRGDVIARVVDDVDRLADHELRVVGPRVAGLTVGLATIVGAALVAPGFGIAYAVAVGIVALALPAACRTVTASIAHRQATARADLASTTIELAEHLDELTSSGAAGAWTDRMDRRVDQLGRDERRRGVRLGALHGLAALAAPLLAAAIVLVDRHLHGSVSGPVLAVLVLVPLALMEVLSPLLDGGAQEAAVREAARRVRAVLEAPDPVAEPATPASAPPWPTVVLDGVALRWPGADVDAVRGLDVRLAPGARARIDGPSGSGKSTVAAALVRFVEVRDGRYLLDDVDAACVGGDHVREVVTWCQQSPWLAATSLRENLHIAAPAAADDELWAALGAVQLADWAHALPRGLDTLVGRDGAAMSGGQRQRLALARVALAGHRVVVLDEPTAHLDEATAARVLRDLLHALGDRTVVVLGHREHEQADERDDSPALTIVGAD